MSVGHSLSEPGQRFIISLMIDWSFDDIEIDKLVWFIQSVTESVNNNQYKAN